MKNFYRQLTHKNKVFVSLGIALTLSVIIFGIALAVSFTVGNVDGVWSTIDTNGATCDRWATCSNPGAPTCEAISNTNPAVQTGSTTDENQVRYGTASGDGDCSDSPFFPPTAANLYVQSGFGFNGQNDSSFMPAFNTPFPLGQFTHYNNPISASNSFEYVDLAVNVPVTCPAGTTPSDPQTLNITYRFFLDETSNSAPCAYPGTPNCPDKVTVLNTGLGTTQITCYGDAGSGAGEYTIQVLGFVPGTCSPNPCGGTVSNEFITNEQANNPACLCGKVTEYTPTAVKIEYFVAITVNNNQDVLLNWKTVSEIDNAGFKLYRGQSVSGTDKALVATIPAKNPGVYGTSAEYEYLDKNLANATTYYYWLSAVDLNYLEEEIGQVPVVTQEKQQQMLYQQQGQYNDWRDWVLKWLEYRKNPNG